MSKSVNDLSTWGTFCRLWPMISPFKIGLVVSSITLIINAVSDALMLALLRPLLDDGFGKANKDVFAWMPLVVVCLMGLRGISGFVSNYCISWVSGKVVMQMRRQLFTHMMNMPVSFFGDQPVGKLLSRITYDSEQVAASSSGALITVVREGASIIGLCTMMFYYSWQLSLILIAIAPIVSLTIYLVSHRFRQISEKVQNAMGQVASSAEQMLKGHKEILIFGAQDIENENFRYISNRMRQQGMKMVAAVSASDPLIQFIASLALATVLYAASIPSIMETLTPGIVTVVFSSMIVLMKPLKSLTNVNAQFQRGMAACQALFSILDMSVEKDKGTFEVKGVTDSIVFNHVTFSYPGKDIPTLHDINFSIPAGKTIALVGRSGSGKTTIANLLTRFYNVHDGEILIDGMNISQYKLSSLRNQIALVSQNIHLFNDTIANNISYASNNLYSREEIEKAARMACAMGFIEKMGNGLDTMIGENGVLLSGGQRQSIAIARALLRDCSILILDEATSALDLESEWVIQKALDTLRKNRSSLIIAHRLSTVEKADEILVIDNGRIIDRGIHEILIKRQGIYSQLYHLQFS